MKVRHPVLPLQTILLVAVFIAVSLSTSVRTKNEFNSFQIVLFGEKDLAENKRWALGRNTAANTPPSPSLIEDPLERLIICWHELTISERKQALAQMGLPLTTTYSELFRVPRKTPSSQNQTCQYPA